MSDANREQSMEEILASIKRVIAEDGKPAGHSPRGRTTPKSVPASTPDPQPGTASAQHDEEDVLELSTPLEEDPALVSEDAAATARQSLATLAALRQSQPEPAGVQHGDGPLEAIVREMLRPMLKEWLDTRLPEMVEDMVAREIGRITGRRL